MPSKPMTNAMEISRANLITTRFSSPPYRERLMITYMLLILRAA